MTAALCWVGAVHLGATVWLTGSLFLLILAGPPETEFVRRWEVRVLKSACWLTVAALASDLVALALQAAVFEGRWQAAFEPAAAARVVLETRLGTIWALRCGLLVLAALWLSWGGEPRAKRDWLAARGEAFLLAAASLALMSGASHAAAMWENACSWFIDAAHLLGAGVWAGALPSLALLMSGPAEAQAARTLRRFSRVAVIAVILLAITGLGGVWLLTGDFAALVGTSHGRLLLVKLTALTAALVLAAKVRAALPVAMTAPRVGRLIAAEAVFAAVILGFAAALRAVSPGVGESPAWPWAWRVVIDIAPLWPRAAQPMAAGVLALALATTLVAMLRARSLRWLLPASLIAVALVGASVVLRPALVEAFPTSFARSPVAYSADAIAEGAALYQTHCTSCHGTPKFDGVARSGGAVELLATESALRTAGELYALISQGDAARRMPGFAENLTEAQRWSLVIYLRALADAGFCRALATRIGETVEPGSAWLAAPDFEVAVGPLTPRSLRDLRGKRMALVVLYELPASSARLAELARRYGALSVQGLEIVAAPTRSSAQAIAELGQTPPVLFPIVTVGAEAVHAAYRMFAPGSGPAELLVDRQGYIRAIWRNATGLPDVDVIQAQVEALNAEKAPPPPPDDHIH